VIEVVPAGGADVEVAVGRQDDAVDAARDELFDIDSILLM
jgi:hypothetical protein